jgi:MtN3 and saliva related transmembrane protein
MGDNTVNLEISQILGWTATIMFSLMLLPQIIKTIKTKSTEGVSISLFFIYLIANIIAIIYAFLINQPPLIIKYYIAIISAMIYITIYAFYFIKNNKLK